MVFDNGEYQENRNTNAAQRLQALRAASCVKILGKGVIKVVHRVDDAKENNNLGRYILKFFCRYFQRSHKNIEKHLQK